MTRTGSRHPGYFFTGIGWPHAPFEIPADIRAAWDQRAAGTAAQQAWQGLFDRYAAAHPALAAELQRRWSGALPADWSAKRTRPLCAYPTVATYKGSGSLEDASSFACK